MQPNWKNNMSQPKSIISTDDLEMADRVADLSEYGHLQFEDLEVVSEKNGLTAAEDAAFMEEPVIIVLELSGDPNAATFEAAHHNGVTQYLERGRPQKVKRKFLYSLLVARKVGVACNFGRKPDGTEFNRVVATPKTTHQVRLLEDKNPKAGMAWVQKVSREAFA